MQSKRILPQVHRYTTKSQGRDDVNESLRRRALDTLEQNPTCRLGSWLLDCICQESGFFDKVTARKGQFEIGVTELFR